MPHTLSRAAPCCNSGGAAQAACRQVSQVQDAHTHELHDAHEQLPHEQVAWLQVAQVQSEQSHIAQLSLQFAHEQVVHSS